jgi:hypothetical protein
MTMLQSHNDTLCCTPSTGKGTVMAVIEEFGYSSVLTAYHKCWHTHEGAGICWLVLQIVANLGPSFWTQIQVKNGVIVSHNLPKEDELQMCAISWKMVSLSGCNKCYSFECNCLGWQLNLDHCNETQRSLNVYLEPACPMWKMCEVLLHHNSFMPYKCIHQGGGPLQNCCCTQPAVLTSDHLNVFWTVGSCEKWPVRAELCGCWGTEECCVPTAAEEWQQLYKMGTLVFVQRWKKTGDKDKGYIEK